MNEHDLENLHFLLNVSEEGLQKWYDQATDDDLLYALELMHQCRNEMDEAEIEIKLENSELSEAKQFLKRFGV